MTDDIKQPTHVLRYPDEPARRGQHPAECPACTFERHPCAGAGFTEVRKADGAFVTCRRCRLAVRHDMVGHWFFGFAANKHPAP